MNLDYLRTYLEVIRLGSFSEVLSISQPAVSFQIQKLERDLGVHLIDRGQKSITLTDAGRRLLRFAELVEKEYAGLIHDLEQIREEVTGRIIIGVISRVREAAYDVGFCGTPPEGKELDYFKIAEDEIVLIVFPEHPFAHRKEVSFLELQGEPLISREETSGTQRSLQTLLANAGLNTDNWTRSLILGSTQAVVSAVEARVGIAFVSNLAIKKSLDLGLVKEVPVEGLKLKRDFYCIYRKERVVSRLLKEFLHFVQARAAYK
jgi:DNA-binding transcriptional LysR family regulator